ncbi:hypothetical protein LEMLEM_LOCUS2077, partial [Lemmus lemmus]
QLGWVADLKFPIALESLSILNSRVRTPSRSCSQRSPLPPWHEDFINSVLIGSLSIREAQTPRLAGVQTLASGPNTSIG